MVALMPSNLIGYIRTYAHIQHINTTERKYRYVYDLHEHTKYFKIKRFDWKCNDSFFHKTITGKGNNKAAARSGSEVYKSDRRLWIEGMMVPRVLI